MILHFLRDWADRKSAKLNSLSISLGVIHESQHCLGQILLWESQQFEMEVVHIGTEELFYWKYLEKIDCNTNLNEITSDYFKVLQTSLRI